VGQDGFLAVTPVMTTTSMSQQVVEQGWNKAGTAWNKCGTDTNK